MSDDEIISFWGKDSLVRWPSEVVAKSDLPEDTTEFLTEVGLPCGVDWTVRFDLTTDEMRRSLSAPRFAIIGYDDEIPICMDKQRQGCVVSIEANARERFVNSDLRRFAECLVLYQRYRLAVQQEADEEEIQRLISRTDQAMRVSDSAAFNDAESWWAVVVEQMRTGFL